VYIPGGAAHVEQLSELDEVGRFIAEAFKHGKPIGMTGEAVQLMPADADAPGLVRGDASSLGTFVEQFTQAIGQHRFAEREGARGGIGASRRRLR
jgi:catalase